jgi:RND family efflux transporter MFP subunit
VFEVADFGELKARIDVPERVSGLIQAGQPVSLRVDALGERTYPATIDRVMPTVDRATGTVGALVAVENTDGALRPGLFVRLAIEYQHIERATLLPKTAVVTGASGSHVYVVEAGSKVARKPVRTGLDFGERVQVLEGVAPGATVVTVGQQSLDDGDVVTVVDARGAVAAN